MTLAGGRSGANVARPGKAASGRRRWWLRGFAIVLNLALVGGVGYVKLRETHLSHRVVPPALTTVQVAVGSEDLQYLMDHAVMARFAKLGLRVVPTPFGSGQIAETVNPGDYDAFFVSSQVFAEVAEARLHQTITEYQPFTTPLAVFTWKGLLQPLRTLGIVNSAGQFDIANYMAVVDQRTRWNEVSGDPLPGDSTQVILTMTNPTQSDSGAMFVAAASYVLNHGNMVSADTDVNAIAGKVAPAIIPLGLMPTTTNLAFQDYVRGGMKGVPMVLGYQSEAGHLPPGGVMVPLNLTVDCEHTVLPLDSLGRRFANALSDDPVLQRLAIASGFDTSQPSSETDVFVPVPSILKDLIDDIAADDDEPPL